MSSATRLRRRLAAAAAAIAPIAAACADSPLPVRPNVLLISVDTLRADHLGFLGYDRPTSPELDAFAESAAVFTGAQASASWTLPGMASIFTSTYTSTHGCWGFDSRLDESFLTLPEVLLAGGYDTACVVSHLYCTTRHGMQQGIVHFDDTFAIPEVDPEVATTSHSISDGGVRFLEQKAAANDARPWFLWLHYFDPHDEYMWQDGFSDEFVTPGTRDTVQEAIDLYDGEIRYTDHQIGRVLDALERTAQDENTVVVLIADHGEEFFDHGAVRHGHTLFAELIRVPLVIRAPGLEPLRVDETVRTIDLMPTILDLVGLPIPEAAAGRSLRPFLSGGALDPAPALSELRLNSANEIEAVIQGSLKLVRYRGGTSILFDLASDPGESQDLAGERRDDVARLESLLDAQRSAAEELAKRFDIARNHDLPPSATSMLNALGYTGSTEEDEQ